MSATNSISPAKLLRLIGHRLARRSSTSGPRPNCSRPHPRAPGGKVRRLGRTPVRAKVSSVAFTARSERPALRRPAQRGRRRRNAGGRLRRLERRRPAGDRCAKVPQPRPDGPHRLGDARPAQGRPDRLPLADPPLRRSRRRLPVRRAVRSGGRRRTVRRHAVRCRRRVLEPSRRQMHLRYDGRGIRPRLDRRLLKRWRSSSAVRIRRGPELAPQAAGLLAASLGLSRMYSTTSSSSRPGC